jgi:phosphohistidine phosphatase
MIKDFLRTSKKQEKHTMKLYLMQHGKALTKEENPDRPLTAQGKDEVERTAAFLARAGRELPEIWHSGKRRAEETAGIVAKHLQLQEGGVAMKGLNPNDDIHPVAERLQQRTTSVMIVGHLPFLSRLTSYLLSADTEKSLVQFQMGGIICLTQQDNRWIEEWMIVPEIVP